MTTESLTNPTLPKRRAVLERPAKRKKVEALILQGVSDGDIAKLMNVSRPAITLFRQRHRDELQAMVAEVERQIEGAAIAHKVNRVWDAQADYDRLGNIIEARSKDTRYDEPGYSTGLMAHTLRQIGTGKNAELVDEYKVDTALVAERRTLRRAVAEELDQLPNGNNINIDARQIIVRQYVGVNPQELE